MSSSYTKTRIMVECALMIALGTILANIKIYELPNGGSITLFSMLPFIMISFRHGVKWGLFTGFVNSLLQTAICSAVTALAVLLLAAAYAVVSGMVKRQLTQTEERP